MPTIRRATALPLILLTAAVLLAPSADAHGATISYAQRFFLTTHDVFPDFPGEPGGLGNSPRVQHFLSELPGFTWAVPAFDPALGVAEHLTLELEAQASMTGRVPYGEVFAHVGLIDPMNMEIFENVGTNAICSTACAFSTFMEIEWSMMLADPMGTLPLSIGNTVDQFATWEAAAGGVVRTAYVGVLRATYTYEPAAAPIPEPATWLLLGTGLTACAGRLRTRRGLQFRRDYPSS